MFGWTVNMPWWLLIIVGMFAVPILILWYTFYFIFVWTIRNAIRAKNRGNHGHHHSQRRWTP